MDKDLSKATEENLLRAAQIEERTTDTIHQLEQNLQNKKIALLSFLTATLFGWLGLALGSGGLSVLQWSALLVVLIGGFGPGLVAVDMPDYNSLYCRDSNERKLKWRNPKPTRDCSPLTRILLKCQSPR